MFVHCRIESYERITESKAYLWTEEMNVLQVHHKSSAAMMETPPPPLFILPPLLDPFLSTLCFEMQTSQIILFL